MKMWKFSKKIELLFFKVCFSVSPDLSLKMLQDLCTIYYYYYLLLLLFPCEPSPTVFNNYISNNSLIQKCIFLIFSVVPGPIY